MNQSQNNREVWEEEFEKLPSVRLLKDRPISIMEIREFVAKQIDIATEKGRVESEGEYLGHCKKILDKIESLSAEFGRDPKECLKIMGEYIGEIQHNIRLRQQGVEKERLTQQEG